MKHGTVMRGGKERKVKNLGWLLKHADEVERFTVYEDIDGGSHMTAHLKDGGTFTIEWASARVMHDWLKRPSFRETKLEYRNTPPEGHKDDLNPLTGSVLKVGDRVRALSDKPGESDVGVIRGINHARQHATVYWTEARETYTEPLNDLVRLN